MLGCALNSTNADDPFRILLRFFWELRAREYFDGRPQRLAYIPHRYTFDYLAPHTIVGMDYFSSRLDVDFSDRNPLLEEEYILRILNIHAADQPGNAEFDIFRGYETRRFMSSSEYYIEDRIIQFYRILFFVQELGFRGIWTDEDDTYDGPVPYEVLPRDVQSMVYDDNKYRDFLLTRRRNELRRLAGNVTRQDLLNARVCEEDLLMNSRLSYITT